MPQIGPVAWAAHGGDLLEKVMAVLLAQEHPNVIRRIPSSGDGGVDICVPTTTGFDVYQIKGFAFRIGASERRQISESWNSLRDDPRLRSPVISYQLIVPVDLTSGEQDWFENLTGAAPFPCHWRGAVFWDSMASRYPYVIDYYLRDGRERVEQRANALLSAFQTGQPLQPLQVAASLDLLRSAVNREHPHFVFDFVASDEAPDPEAVPTGVAMAYSQQVQGEGWVTILVRPRHAHALADAPIGGTLTVAVDRGTGLGAVADAMEDFLTFGTGVELPAGSIGNLSITAPAGLGGNFEGGVGRIGPASISEAPSRWRLAAVHPVDGDVAEAVVVTQSATRGERGGIELIAKDAGGAFEFLARISPPAEDGCFVTYNLHALDATNKPVTEVLPGTRFLAALQPPTMFELREEHGSGVLGRHTFTSSNDLIEPEYLRFLEHLAVLQTNVRGTVRVPSSISDEQARELAEAVYLLRHGEVRGTWTDMRLALQPGVNREEMRRRMAAAAGADVGTFAVEASATVELETGVFELGPLQMILATARAADLQPDDETTLVIVPAHDATFVRRLGRLLGSD